MRMEQHALLDRKLWSIDLGLIISGITSMVAIPAAATGNVVAGAPRLTWVCHEPGSEVPLESHLKKSTPEMVTI